jgi:hypothetical protein
MVSATKKYRKDVHDVYKGISKPTGLRKDIKKVII